MKTNKEILQYFREYESTDLENSISYGTGDVKAVIFGATHGNEPAGPQAIYEYHRYLCEGDIQVNGQIRFVIGNPMAYKNNVRGIKPNGLKIGNLNRVFTDRILNHNYEGERGLEIRNFFSKNDSIQAVLDLHSVSGDKDVRLAAYIASEENLIRACKISSLDLHFAFHAHHMPGTLMEEAARHGFEAMAVECGKHHSIYATTVAREHIKRFLNHYGILNSNVKDMDQTIRYYETIAPVVPATGFKWLVDDLDSEYFLKKGTIFAHDSWHGEHKTTRDCYMMIPSKNPDASDKDAGFLCKRRTI